MAWIFVPLQDGNITLEEFLQANWPRRRLEAAERNGAGRFPVLRHVVGRDHRGAHCARLLRSMEPSEHQFSVRSSISRPRARRAIPGQCGPPYTSGMVFGGKLDDPRSIIASKWAYCEALMLVVHVEPALPARARQDGQLGRARDLGSRTALPKVSQSFDALTVMDEWMRNIRANPHRSIRKNRPARAVDSCFDVNGQLIYTGYDAWNGILDDKAAGPCTQRFPLYSTTRIVAGAPLEGGIFRCALEPVERAVVDDAYQPRSLTAEQNVATEKDLPAGSVRLQQAGLG